MITQPNLVQQVEHQVPSRRVPWRWSVSPYQLP